MVGGGYVWVQFNGNLCRFPIRIFLHDNFILSVERVRESKRQELVYYRALLLFPPLFLTP